MFFALNLLINFLVSADLPVCSLASYKCLIRVNGTTHDLLVLGAFLNGNMYFELRPVSVRICDA